MKYLLILFLIGSLPAFSQSNLDARIRSRDALGRGLSQRSYTNADSVAISLIRPSTSANLFDLNAQGNVKNHYVFSTTGQILANAIYNATTFIAVTPGLTYVPTAKQQGAFYDAAGTFVSGLDAGRTNTFFTVPTGVAYVRLTVLITGWSLFELELGTVSTAYTPFGTRLPRTLVATVADGSVGLQKLGFATPGKNLFNLLDPGNLTGNYVFFSTGAPLPSAAYNLTGFIAIDPGIIYMPTFKHQIAFYDANRVYLSGLDSGRPFQYFVTPANAAFVRLGVGTFSWNTFQLEAGSSSTTYEPYKGFLLNAEVRLSATTAENSIAPSAVAIAPKLYIPAGRELAVYSENVQKNFIPYRDKMLVDIPEATQKIMGRGSKITPAATGTLSGTVSVGDHQFTVISTTPVIVNVVSSTVATAVKILNIGDSYTFRSTFVNSLSAVGGVTYLGTRTSTASNGSVLSEGRGGFVLSQYVNQSTTLYMPFMQPTATYAYVGNTSFWIAANAGMTDAVGQGYDVNRFVQASQFNAATGYPTTPQLNDLIYDNGLVTYRFWTGTVWTSIAAPTFAFSFAKYRARWGIVAPNVVHILLGTNDFGGTGELQFTTAYGTYKTGMDIMTASILADSPTAKIIIGMPVSSGRQGEFGTLFTEKRKRAYWLLANALVTDYAGKEAQNIYLADYHASVDRAYGYDNAAELPYANYSGTERIDHKADFTHLGADGFRQMGDIYMGLIQALR